MRRLLINLAIILVLACGPITIFAIGWGYTQIYHQFGMVPFVIACLSGTVTILGIASLIDKVQERRNPPPHAR